MRNTVCTLGVLAALMAKSALAVACSPPFYERVFVPSGTVPANGFAAEIGDPSRSLPELVDAAGVTVELITSQGPAGTVTVKSAQALVPGAHYTFRFLLGRDGIPTESVAQSVDLVAGPSAPAPETAGALRVETETPASSSNLQSFHIRWDRAPALAPYGSMLGVLYLVDGMPLSGLGIQGVQDVQRVCDRPQPLIDSCGAIIGVPPGHHTVTLSARVYGSADLPLLTAPIDVQCPAPDAGCTVAAGSTDASLTGLAVVAALLLHRRRRGSRPGP